MKLKPLIPLSLCLLLLPWAARTAPAAGPGPGPVLVNEARHASIPLWIRGEGSATFLRWRWEPLHRGDILSTTVYRRAFPPAEAGGWGVPLAVLEPGVTEFAVEPAASHPWEYQVVAVQARGGKTCYGYAVVGPRPAPPQPEGVLILLERDLFAGAPRLAAGLQALRELYQQQGLVPAELSVNATDAPLTVRTLVQALAARQREQGVTPRYLLLLGPVPVPYSGNFAPDGHSDHWGAWPTDTYYGDLDGEWTDDRVNRTTAADPRQHNVPGDGKFDQNELPGRLDLAVGRVDFAALTRDGPDGGLGRSLQREWLARWLERRVALPAPAARIPVLVDDRLAAFPEAFATTPWRLAPLLVAGQSPLEAPFRELSTGTQRAELAFGYGAGSFTAARGVVSTPELLRDPLRARFVFLFGSYFADWAAPDNLLTAALAGPPGTEVLASAWAARPAWQLHPLAAGYTLGHCQLLTANHTQDYPPGLREAYPIHLALQGDPTLTLTSSP